MNLGRKVRNGETQSPELVCCGAETPVQVPLEILPLIRTL